MTSCSFVDALMEISCSRYYVFLRRKEWPEERFLTVDEKEKILVDSITANKYSPTQEDSASTDWYCF